MVQKIEKYIKFHVLGDIGDIWIGIPEDIQKIDFSSNRTENLTAEKLSLSQNSKSAPKCVKRRQKA